MPEITVDIPSCTHIEFDLAEILDSLDVDIDDETLFDAVRTCDDPSGVLHYIKSEDICSYLVEHPKEVDDETIMALVQSRDDLVKLGLALADQPALTIADQLYQVITTVDTADDPVSTEPLVKSFVRHLLCNDNLRRAVTDALGEHYAKAPLVPLVAVAEAAK